MLLTPDYIVATLQRMNWQFGRGEISAITINIEESTPMAGKWFGTVTIKSPGMEDDIRYWKCVDNYVTFRSRKRKLNRLKRGFGAIYRKHTTKNPPGSL